MTYKIEILPSAKRSLVALPKKIQKQIDRGILSLSENARPQGVKKLKKTGDLYRIRSGDYRVIYQIKDDILTILIIRIGHRKDIYRKL
ncbi:MAG: type II toxin-antitoxin system RelE/ParE family toxin [Candidatus Aminicenantes bacterium]|nr:type II toxin-antitoxin system RelE/ParE family toxin [Candidatus Aminicenantes bacterium]